MIRHTALLLALLLLAACGSHGRSPSQTDQALGAGYHAGSVSEAVLAREGDAKADDLERHAADDHTAAVAAAAEADRLAAAGSLSKAAQEYQAAKALEQDATAETTAARAVRDDAHQHQAAADALKDAAADADQRVAAERKIEDAAAAKARDQATAGWVAFIACIAAGVLLYLQLRQLAAIVGGAGIALAAGIIMWGAAVPLIEDATPWALGAAVLGLAGWALWKLNAATGHAAGFADVIEGERDKAVAFIKERFPEAVADLDQDLADAKAVAAKAQADSGVQALINRIRGK